jgi:hypothetical protein
MMLVSTTRKTTRQQSRCHMTPMRKADM